jgi:heme exporter protein C
MTQKQTSLKEVLAEIPAAMQKEITRWNRLLLLFSGLLGTAWMYALFGIGADRDQGNVYRIIFCHVPAAWCAFLWVMAGGFFGLRGMLAKKNAERFDRSSHAAMEMGTLFGVLALVTGSIWGRPTWGVWWDWDPRLTSTLVMVLVSSGYLILREFTPDIQSRRTVAGMTSILSAINVPIVYFSVKMWRSLHQPQTFVPGKQGSNASSDISSLMWLCVLLLVLVSFAIYKIRRQGIAAAEQLAIAREQA